MKILEYLADASLRRRQLLPIWQTAPEGPGQLPDPPTNPWCLAGRRVSPAGHILHVGLIEIASKRPKNSELRETPSFTGKHSLDRRLTLKNWWT
jgi:hypothetical protein